MARGALTVLFELALVFCGRIFTRLRPPPSARFSRINHRSRNRSSPLFSCQRPRQALPPVHNLTSANTTTPTEIPADGRGSLGAPGVAAILWRSCGCGCGPEMRWPLRALAVAETRPQGPAGRVGAGHEVRASPEMRPGSHDDWAATPQASHSHHLRRQTVLGWLLYVTRNLKDFCRPSG